MRSARWKGGLVNTAVGSVTQRAKLKLTAVSSCLGKKGIHRGGEVGVRRTVRGLRFRMGRITEKLGAGQAGAVKVVLPRLGGVFFSRVVATTRSLLEDRKCTAVVYSYESSIGQRRRTTRFLLREEISNLVVVPAKTRGGMFSEFEGSKEPIMLVSQEVRGKSYSYILMSGRKTTRGTIGQLVGGNRGGVNVVAKPSGMCATERHRQKCRLTLRRSSGTRSRRRSSLGSGASEGSAGLLTSNGCAVTKKTGTVHGLCRSGPSVATMFVSGCRVAIKTVVRVGSLKVGIPGRLSIVKFSGISFTETMMPELSVIARPARRVKRTTTGLLLDHLRSGSRASSGASSGARAARAV